jgi:phosphocarrier protein HPr
MNDLPSLNMGATAPVSDVSPLQRTVTIINKKGLHARATAKFVGCAEQFAAKVIVCRGDEEVAANSIMGILTLGAGIGTELTLTASGEDAQAALDALQALIEDRFGEGE